MASVYLPIIQTAEMTDERNAVVEYLKENNCTIAYATFENANSMTVLSDGTVTVAAVSSLERMDACKWLSSSGWYVPNIPFDEKTAYIVTEAEQEAFNTFLEAHKEEIWYETQRGKYLVYMSEHNFSKLN